MADFRTAFVQWRDDIRPRSTNPSILSLSITSDGFLIARTGGSKSRDTQGGSFLGRASSYLGAQDIALVKARQ